MLDNSQKKMKWYGWGYDNEEFDAENKPWLVPYMTGFLNIQNLPSTPPIARNELRLPAARRHKEFESDARKALGDEAVRQDDDERLTHAGGKSYYDLWRLRHGVVHALPDYVLYPRNEEEVVALIRAADTHGVVVTPFGGGSNVAGCLEPVDGFTSAAAQGATSGAIKDASKDATKGASKDATGGESIGRNKGRIIASLDTTRINRVLEVDMEGLTARIEAGALGTVMEEQLNAHGVTLGHFPDSYLHSTLGGWIATRSAGMQSDGFGNIEDMVVSLRMVSPAGTIVTRNTPRASSGPDVNHLCIGSEGIYGIITEATVRVRPIAKHRRLYGFLFPDYRSGTDAVYEAVRRNCNPLATRLNDELKTALSFAFRSADSPTISGRIKKAVGNLVQFYLRRVRRFDFDRVALCIVALEADSSRELRRAYRKLSAVYHAHGVASLGGAPGRSFERNKYDFPHMRDFTMDHGILADISETSTTWSNLRRLYDGARLAIEDAIRSTGNKAWVGCHISHTYADGASLYYTFACAEDEAMGIEQYFRIKKAAEDAFMRYGGTLSHHHAVGLEHSPWMEDEISATGLLALKALKKGLDPNNIMNPGKMFQPTHYADTT